MCLCKSALCCHSQGRGVHICWVWKDIEREQLLSLCFSSALCCAAVSLLECAKTPFVALTASSVSWPALCVCYSAALSVSTREPHLWREDWGKGLRVSLPAMLLVSVCVVCDLYCMSVTCGLMCVSVNSVGAALASSSSLSVSAVWLCCSLCAHPVPSSHAVSPFVCVSGTYAPSAVSVCVSISRPLCALAVQSLCLSRRVCACACESCASHSPPHAQCNCSVCLLLPCALLLFCVCVQWSVLCGLSSSLKTDSFGVVCECLCVCLYLFLLVSFFFFFFVCYDAVVHVGNLWSL